MDHNKDDGWQNFQDKRKRHPANLRGKEIGLFYRNLKREKNPTGESSSISATSQHEGKTFSHLGPDITLPEKLINQIEEKLSSHIEVLEKKIETDFENYFKEILSTSFEEFLEIHSICSHEEMEIELKAENQIIADPVNVETSTQSKNTDPQIELGLEKLQKYKCEDLELQSSLKKTNTFDTVIKPTSEEQLKLPVYKHKEEILAELNRSRFVLISGDTGCGKTTQIPQIILNSQENPYDCHIICTQPRRISAITVAERVAYERREILGNSVGYQIRLEGNQPRSTASILFCTAGILLKRLEGDPMLSNVSHIILDEIHERNIESDLLISLLKIVTQYNKKIKIIMMSATFGIEDFAKHFTECSIIQIKGTLFDVEVKYLEDILAETNYLNNKNCVLLKNVSDKRHQKKHFKYTKRFRDLEKQQNAFEDFINPYARSLVGSYTSRVIEAIQNPNSEDFNLDLLLDLIFHISESKPEGAILVFLPGFDKISKVGDAIKNSRSYQVRRYALYMLHSMMPTLDQKEVFQRPPAGTRKVILATNIAETSITIDDVVYVINSGKVKMNDYNLERNYQTLEEKFVTIAHFKQRKGRAGRCQPGICYNLYTRAREYTFQEYPLPEIQRSRLEPVVLNLKMLKIHDCKGFFSKMISPPQEKAIDNGILLLKRIHALEENEKLTPLGLHLAKIPVDPQIGKMLLISAIFNCVNPIASICATLSHKDPFYLVPGKEKEIDACKKKLSNSTNSDHLMIANVFDKFYWAQEQNYQRKFCYDNFLSSSTIHLVEKMKLQLSELLYMGNFINDSNPRHVDLNINSKNEKLLKAVIAGGLYPNVAWIRKSRHVGNKVRAIQKIETLDDDQKVVFHPGSVNSNEVSFKTKYLVYFNLQKTAALYLYDSSVVHPVALIIFADRITIDFNQTNDKIYITISDKYTFQCDNNTKNVIIKLRNRFEALLQKLALHPTVISSSKDSADKNLIEALILLFNYDKNDSD